MRKLLLIALLAILSVNISNAQRFTDELDRGIVAVNLGGQIFVSWRILPEEYYGTTYKLYKNGSLVADDIVASNWTGSGSASDQFTVAPVINGIEGEQSAVAKVWNKSGSSQAGYIDFDLQPVLDRNGNDVTHHYMPNDAIFADLLRYAPTDYLTDALRLTKEGGKMPKIERYRLKKALQKIVAASNIELVNQLDAVVEHARAEAVSV